MVELGLSCNFSLRTYIWTGKASRKEWADIEPTGLISWYFQSRKTTRKVKVPRAPQGYPGHVSLEIFVRAP